jgi:chromosome segregation ATPase
MTAVTWRKAGVYVLIAVPLFGVAGIAAIAQQNQDATQEQGVDPVADAARKARQQKKDAPKPKKVFTNEDVSTAPSAATPSNTAPAPTTNSSTPADTKEEVSGQAAAGDKTASDKSAPAPKNDEATWRGRFRDERAKLADAERELDILQREAQKAQVQYYSDPQKAMAEQYNRKDVNEKDTKIAAKKEEIEKIKQHIADMEDELRRAGGEIGWARE